jgi:hypothetical protein
MGAMAAKLTIFTRAMSRTGEAGTGSGTGSGGAGGLSGTGSGGLGTIGGRLGWADWPPGAQSGCWPTLSIVAVNFRMKGLEWDRRARLEVQVPVRAVHHELRLFTVYDPHATRQYENHAPSQCLYQRKHVKW